MHLIKILPKGNHKSSELIKAHCSNCRECDLRELLKFNGQSSKRGLLENSNKRTHTRTTIFICCLCLCLYFEKSTDLHIGMMSLWYLIIYKTYSYATHDIMEVCFLFLSLSLFCIYSTYFSRLYTNIQQNVGTFTYYIDGKETGRHTFFFCWYKHNNIAYRMCYFLVNFSINVLRAIWKITGEKLQQIFLFFCLSSLI